MRDAPFGAYISGELGIVHPVWCTPLTGGTTRDQGQRGHSGKHASRVRARSVGGTSQFTTGRG